ncbi:helix-turn-helix transcriptional regulator [Ideonella sp. 4Y16]|uniref:Helix-turn-helix transcriptional regulator n=1 Tax=Ideonella alba TaxID=2824118 RepID=A0A940YH89_9BURK|nr:substrate-binding domain-containing protein [Ideonella alba]MBQ0933326.1 helix-turn-helix transcriptional regulator [Ideonella alba]MBQ0943626.1 helix-turn-helix transcriptional regulator [Ideonella alba]
MKSRGVHLQYSFQSDGQRGADIQNPLFDLLSALRQHGSIQHAATATGASYRHVWGALKQWELVIGEPLVLWAKGQPARLTPFAERLLWAEARARTRMTPHIEALRSELERVLAEALDGSHQVLTIYASHDLALPALRECAAEHHRLHIDLRFAGSMDALRALSEGRCTVAGFHVPPLEDARNLFAEALKPLLKPGVHKLIGCTRRTQGLMVARGNPLRLRGLADLASGSVRFINRQEGSGTRLLTDHLLAQQGLSSSFVPRYHEVVEDSHLAVAAAIASGLGDAGVGIAAAAEQFGLDLVPLVEEDYFLVCLKDALQHPAVQQLCEALAGAPMHQAVSALPGYALNTPGEVLSLTRALPWWHFRTRKEAHEARHAAE